MGLRKKGSKGKDNHHRPVRAVCAVRVRVMMMGLSIHHRPVRVLSSFFVPRLSNFVILFLDFFVSPSKNTCVKNVMIFCRTQGGTSKNPMEEMKTLGK